MPARTFVFLCIALLAAGCATQTQQGAVTGAVLGGALGAVIGHQSGEEAEGAIVGAVAGAIVGAAIADGMSSRQATVEQTMTADDKNVREELELTLLPEKLKFAVGEPIVLQLSLDNVSEHDVYISSPSFYYDGDLALVVETPDGPLTEPNGALQEFLCTTGRGKGVQYLRAGRGLRRQIVINPGTGGRLPDDIVYHIPALDKPGEYTFKAVAYHRYSTEIPSSADALEEGQGREITLTSNLVRISVGRM